MKKGCAAIAFSITDYPSETMGSDSLTCVNIGGCIKIGEKWPIELSATQPMC